ncbi:hypothetical protein SAMN02746095_02952 [Acidocella aminolytica 101 = DSM 11237]|nr:hypothetical protein SAMN02746095_02952 [Acidocella aminolytica 101 = DSM 11237]
MSGFWGFRFFQAYGLLEYRMTNLAPYEFQVVRYHLNYLVQLEAAQATASDNLDTNQASVWLHNQNEIRDRAILFDEWRRKLCNAVGIPPGPQLEGAATGRITI